MGVLTEAEIFDRMRTSSRLAAECADALAVLPLKGPTYDRLRRELKLIEGCCKQAAVWREDSRWLPLGVMMEQCHQRAGDWLRGEKVGNFRVKHSLGYLHDCFAKLAENLRGLDRMLETLRTQKTQRVGMILPAPLPGPHRDTRPVQVLLPAHMAAPARGLIDARGRPLSASV